MKYRTKLYLALVGIALASSLLALIILSTETEKLLFRMLRSGTLSVAATTAAQLDPDLVLKVTESRSIADPAYVKLRSALLKVLNANRREDIYISLIYTLYIDPNNPNNLLNGVETDPDPDLPGSPYIETDKELVLKNYDRYFTDPTFITDQYGVWLSGFAPIKDRNGKTISTLSVSINATDIHMRLKELLKFATWGLLASLFLALTVSYVLSKRVTVSLHHLRDVVKEIEAGNLNAKAHLTMNDEFGELSNTINAMTKGLKERERLKMSFARYVSTHILEKILISEFPLKLEGERRKVTILFSDIRQFTHLAENLPPEKVVNLLNEYFEVMIEIIFSNFGTLDKFIGDGIMAEFGAPLDDKQQEEHAIRAAIAMQKQLVKLCDKWEKENKPRIQIGIGIHTGEAVLGNVGSEKRIEYTAIGDAVNVASRLEQATKILQTPILLSETTYLGAKDKFIFKDLGAVTLPGRKEEIRIYTINFENE